VFRIGLHAFNQSLDQGYVLRGPAVVHRNKVLDQVPGGLGFPVFFA